MSPAIDPAITLRAASSIAAATGLLQRLPGLDFVLQLAGLGGLIGTGHALLAVLAILIQVATEVLFS